MGKQVSSEENQNPREYETNGENEKGPEKPYEVEVIQNEDEAEKLYEFLNQNKNLRAMLEKNLI